MKSCDEIGAKNINHQSLMRLLHNQKAGYASSKKDNTEDRFVEDAIIFYWIDIFLDPK